MDKQILTLENIDKIGLELLKKENGDSNEIKYYWNYDDKFSKEQIDEIKDLKGKNEYETFEDAVSYYLEDMNTTNTNELQINIVENVLKKYVDYDEYSDEYHKISAQLLEIVEEVFEVDMNEMKVLGNTRIEEINVFLCENNKNSLYGESFSVENYKNPILLKEELEKEFNPKTPDKLAESLINEREKRNGAMISSELDEMIFEKYTNEEDFGFEANSLKECMQNYYSKTISLAIDRAEEKIRKSTLLLAEYKIDKNNLTAGDIKSICNIISGGDVGKVFSDIEIFVDIKVEKKLAPVFDIENFDKKVIENLKELYSDWRIFSEKNLRDNIHIDCKDEKARESFNQYVSFFGRKKIDNKMFFEELSYYKDFEIDENIMKTLQDDYNKEHNITDFGKYIKKLKEFTINEKHKNDLIRINEKNKLLSDETLQKVKKEIIQMQGDILTSLEDSNYFEKQGNNYKIQETLLEKDNFGNIVKNFISNNFEFENDIFLKNLTHKELVERYNIATPDFEIYSKNGNEIFYSNIDDYSDIEDTRENLEKFIIETKGQEFWDNMNVYDINDWEDLLKSGEVVGVSINDGVENQFTSVDEYLSFIFEKNNVYDYVYDEIKVYGEELRQELEKNSKDNIISVGNFDKLKEKYNVNDFKDNNREEIEEKEITKTKEIDI